uniref:Uncharacterized protein n=1 Tax=Theropithecus gelada TaxID=9565 RepID=A0A8D2G729_THEGE
RDKLCGPGVRDLPCSSLPGCSTEEPGKVRHSAWLGESAPPQPLCRVRNGRFAISRAFVVEGPPSASTEV